MSRMIAYHWSPRTRREAIDREGLQIGAPPCVNAVDEPHRNRWVSLGEHPQGAWWLSGNSLEHGGFPPEHDEWDLWQADLRGLRARRATKGWPEVKCWEDIPPDRLFLVGSRKFTMMETG